MGTKRPSCTLFDTLSNPNTADRKHQPGGQFSRDPSPRPGTVAQSERERERTREEEWRREREMERMRDKTRYKGKDMDPREKYSERDRAPAPRPREGERERRDRERRQEEERNRNGRPLSNLEKGAEREIERIRKKGDTFPRMRRGSQERDRRTTAFAEKDEERGGKRILDKQKRIEIDDFEREREKAWRRERQREGERYREREDGTVRKRERPRESDPDFRERRRARDLEVIDLRDRREWDAARQREKPRPNLGEREARMPSPRRRRDREIYSDRKDREKAERRDGKRDTKSEGDSDETEIRKERAKDRAREELMYRHCRSEGDNNGKTARENEQDRQRYREEDRQRYREREREREADGSRVRDKGRERGAEKAREMYREKDRRKGREFEREGERWKDGVRDVKGCRQDDRGWPSDRREGDRYREREDEERRGKERKERETDLRWDDAAGRGSRSLSEMAPRPPPRAQSSGEWSSDMDSERRYRRGRDSYEERESGRDSTAESERDVEEERSGGTAAERSRREQKRSETPDRDRGEERTGGAPEQRRMWLEPHRGKNSKDSSVEDEFVERERHTRRKERKRGGEERTMESQTEWGREGRRVKEEQDERYSDQSKSSGRHCETGRHGRREEYMEQKGETERTEGISVDGEEVSEAWRERDKGGKEHLSDSDGGIEGRERENVTDNTEESDREEEGGSDYCARSESEGGSETGWEPERDKMLSGEDGFVTVSSGDGEDEREEEEFEDCREFWEGGISYDDSPPAGFKRYEGEEEREEEWREGKEDRVDEEGEDGEGQGKEKHPKYIFCVIGQTLPRSKPNKTSEPDQVGGAERDNPNSGSSQYGSDDITQQPQDDLHPVLRNDDYPINNNNNQETETKRERDKYNVPKEERPDDNTNETSRVNIRYRTSSEFEDTETGEGVKGKVEHPYAEIGPIGRDSQTEKLLTEWRERNKEYTGQTGRERERLSPSPCNPYGEVGSQGNFVPIQTALDGINLATMSPEEEVAIRIRMSGAWSMTEEAKRHSQAPHLKWAKNVVREILGASEENAIDDPNSGQQGHREINQSERGITKEERQEEMTEGTGEMPIYAKVQKLRTDEQHSEPELDEGEAEPLEVEELRGMGQSQADMHADQLTAMHGDTPTYTHTDTLLDTEREEACSPPMDKKTGASGHLEVEKAAEDMEVIIREEEDEVKITRVEEEASREKEVEMYLSVSNTLYKPSSCPILNYATESDLPVPSIEGKGQGEEDRMGESEEERQGEEREEGDTGEEVGEMSRGEGTEEGSREGEEEAESRIGGGVVKSSCSFRDLGPEARMRRRGIRKTTERRKEELVEEEEEEGVGRDRRTRIFSTPDDEDAKSESWGEVDLRSVLDTIGRRKRNSKFFNAAQLYQQYSEAAQNIEILRQSRSDVLSTCEEHSGHLIAPLPSSSPSSSPAPSPPPARRPLPPLPPVPHPHSLSHTGSITSTTSSKSLPLPEPPKIEGRPSSPRLSISLTQSATLWRDLPGVRNSAELEELTEDLRRLQEVRFEVVTSEASYCRSLDIVVEHFVKSKQLGALLTTQDRNWLFSRLADVRAISHSFLSKLEERVDSDMMQFTVCDIIARHCQRFKMVYVPYLTNQSYQDATYQRLMNENPGFKRIVDKLERSPVCQRLPLRSFLVLPFQRITRIKLLVQNIVKRTAPGTEEVMQAIKALKLLEKLIQESNDSISQMKSIESLVSLSAKVEFECRTLPLISQSRRLVREGLVTELMDFSLKETERNVYLHLFNDYLLLSLHKEGGRFTVIDHAPVSDLRAENCRVKLHSLQKNLFRLHLSNKALLLRTDTQSDKLRWISAVSRPHPEIDFSAAQDFKQMQCIRAFVAQQPDELSLEKADIILVHQQSSDGWVEGTRLSDRHRGWMPESHLETITNPRVQQRNLSDALKLTTATAAV
ncbi:uncharacterized protein arhgef5 isoform X1 [Centroberyx gerrardi]